MHFPTRVSSLNTRFTREWCERCQLCRHKDLSRNFGGTTEIMCQEQAHSPSIGIGGDVTACTPAIFDPFTP